jgi:hypothetical protein
MGVNQKGLNNLLGCHEEGVQIVTIVADCKAEPSSVNEIRPFLEGGNSVSSIPPGCCQAERQYGFSGATFQG